jgi:hypothetical protein
MLKKRRWGKGGRLVNEIENLEEDSETSYSLNWNLQDEIIIQY